MSEIYKYRPRVFFGVTFLVTYILWIVGGRVSFEQGRGGLYIGLMFFGLVTPFVVSVWMILASKNAELKAKFFNRLINLKLFQVNMLPAFLLLMPLSVLISILISMMFGGSWEQILFAEGFSFSVGAVPVLLVLFLAATFEELGWRGYGFDALQSRYSFFAASLVFSVLWSLWHVPLLFVNGSYQQEILNENFWFAVNFFVSIIPLGIIISWVCIKNQKSVLAAILFHFIINMSQEALSMTQSTKAIETGVLAVVAALIVYREREMFFAPALSETYGLRG